MKKVITSIFIVFSIVLFEQCTSNETTQEESKKEATPDQFDEVNKLVWAAKKKKIVFNSSSPHDVSKYVLGDEISGMVKGERFFNADSSIQLKTSVQFKNNNLHEIFYDFFFKNKEKYAARIKEESKKMKEILDTEYGNTIDEFSLEGMQTYIWGGSGYEVRLEIFDDGYTIALKGNDKIVAGNPSTSINDVIKITQPLLNSINNKLIQVGVSTETELESILHFENKYLSVEFSDIRLGGSYTLNDNQTLKAIYYDFFFLNQEKDLPRALADVNLLYEKIKTLFGEPISSELFDNGSMDIWEIDNQRINLNSFEDGYSLSVEANEMDL